MYNALRLLGLLHNARIHNGMLVWSRKLEHHECILVGQLMSVYGLPALTASQGNETGAKR